MIGIFTQPEISPPFLRLYVYVRFHSTSTNTDFLHKDEYYYASIGQERPSSINEIEQIAQAQYVAHSKK